MLTRLQKYVTIIIRTNDSDFSSKGAHKAERLEIVVQPLAFRETV